MTSFLNHEEINSAVTQNLNDAYVYPNRFGFSTIGLHIVPPTGGKLVIEGSYNGSSWFPVFLKNIETKRYIHTVSTSVDVSGTITGYNSIRFRVSVAGSASGSVVGRAQAQQAILGGIDKVNVDLQTGALTTRPSPDLLDSFGRSRVVNPVTLFESSMTYNKRPQFFNEKLVGISSAIHLTDKSLVEMTVGTASGDQVVRQTRYYFRYQVARTQVKTYVAILGSPKAGVVSRVGGFDSDDGFYFEQNENGLQICKRDSTSGSVVNESIPQSSWNADKLDGTGSSGVIIDPTKLVIYGDKFNWHGGGPITLGIYVGGRFIPCHTFDVNNISTTPIIALPNVPIRYEITNTAITASQTSMFQGASSCVVEGGIKIDQSLSFSASNGVVSRTTDPLVFIPILAIRPKATFEGRVNRVMVFPESFTVQSTNGIVIELVMGASISGGTWESVSSESVTEVNRSGTSLSGGRVILTRYVSSTTGSTQANILGEILEDLFISLDIDGANPETIAISVRSLNGTPATFSGINWRESY